MENILQNTENINLDFKIKTIRSDMSAFKKIIPDVDSLLQMADEFVHPSHEFPELMISEMTLTEIREKIKKLYKQLADNAIFEKNKKKNDSDPYPTNDSEVVYSPNGYFRYNWLSSEVKPEIGNENLEKLVDIWTETKSTQEYYSNSMRDKSDSINKYKHRIVKRQIPIPLYEKNGEDKEFVSLDNLKNRDEYLVSIDFPICVVCYTLV